MNTEITAIFARLPLPRFLREDGAMLAGFLGTAALALGFLKFASEVTEGETLAIDRHILRGLRTAADPAVPVGPAWLTQAFVDVTALGGVTVLALVTLASTGFLFAARKPATAMSVAFAIVGGSLYAVGLKLVFERPRPDVVPHLVDAVGLSFPSGHATNSAIVYLTLGALLARAQERGAVRAYLIGIAILLTMLVGFSRIWLGVHWPSDVAAGWCAGAVWALLCWIVERALQRRHAVEAPGEARG
ncbi:phosphatase PAP2 family protein [Sphingomonas sp.]|uniref:phosphatase PAP2 family protein n=1 Tax=Sphingomonas sp. TaxID=28214 RepID=UPI001B1D6A7D|nr:phosphatase PAP2 family protein [Sphingomonas sp.]MBO9711281.1 phosphatase PAP2 family protein [Sphingomonas sp.]